MRRLAAIGLAFAALIGAACEAHESAPPALSVAAEPPPELADGRDLFRTHCMLCHGERGVGTDTGPPLVHIVYEPGHHGDEAFRIAALRGVRAHHWRFGDMPPVAGVTPAEVDRIIAYVRWLQRAAGIN